MHHLKNSTSTSLNLLYDGDCPMCRALVAQLQYWGFLNQIPAQPLQEAAQAENWVDPTLLERGRLEALLVDRQTGQTWGGIDVLIQLLGLRAGFRWISWILRWPLCHSLAQGVYQTISHNRRSLSPVPSSALPCACDPPFNLKFTVLFYLGTLLLLGLALLAFSVGASHSPARFTHIQPFYLLGKLVIATLSGWFLATLASGLPFQPAKRVMIPQTWISLTMGSLYLGLAGLLLLWLPASSGASVLQERGILLLALGIQSIGMLPALRQRLLITGSTAWLPWLWLKLYVAVALAVVFL